MGLSRTCSALPSFRLPACRYPETGKAQCRSSAGQGRRRRYCAYDRPVFFRVRDSDPRPAPACLAHFLMASTADTPSAPLAISCPVLTTFSSSSVSFARAAGLM